MALRLWPRSLIARILLVELGAILLVAILLPVLTVLLLHQQMNRYQVQTLTEQAREISRGVGLVQHRLTVTLKPDLAQTYATPYDGRAYVIVDADGHVKSASAFAQLVPWREAPLATTDRWFRVGALVSVSQPITVGGTQLWVIVSQDETGRGAIIDDVARAFLTQYSPVLLLILLLLPLINSLLIRRLVVEVRSVSEQAEGIGARSLDQRLAEAGLPAEVAPLVHATNALLQRLQESFQHQSEFVANVAHELRTPLATLRFQLENVEDDGLREQLGRTAERLTHVISQLQALAALEVSASSFAHFDLVELAREIISELAPRILENGDRIALSEPGKPVEICANRTLIGVALSNLISNATTHTPPGTEIGVRVAADGSIEVVDDGPGIASSDVGRSRQRYWRADNRRSDSAGLGLSIVGRIMQVHDTDLVIESTPGAGARFVMLPPSTQIIEI